MRAEIWCGAFGSGVDGGESPGEFVRDAGAAEVGIGIFGVWASRVDDGECAWEAFDGCGWGVVVCDDEFKSGVVGGPGRLHGGDAAVNGDDQPRAVVGE